MFFVLLAIGTAPYGCSGGSGGSDGSSSGITYTGATNPAMITSDNTNGLIHDGFEGALTSDSMVPFSIAPAGTQQASTSPMVLALQKALGHSLSDALNTSGGSAGHSAAKAAASDTMTGDCGGTASYSVSYNETSGAFSGSFSYSGFCSDGVTLSGSATFTGRIDSSSGTFDYFTFSFSNLATTADGLSNTLNGSLECDFQGSDVSITADMVVSHSSGGQVCWLNNYTVQVSGNQIDISGRYYDPVYGYVDFFTEEPLILSEGDPYPSAGLIMFSGAAGPYGQPTSARLRAISNAQCQVTADFDGDGIFEFDSGYILWSEL